MTDTTTATDEFWSKAYDDGQDFVSISSLSLSRLLQFTEPDLPKTCLDIGSGTGQLTRELYHRGFQCVGIDASASAINIAESLTFLPRNQLQYVHFDIENDDIATLPYDSYELITCKLAYAFIKDKHAFLERVQQMLAPGGIFIVITPHIDDIPADRGNMTVDDHDIALLDEYFTCLASSKGDEHDRGLVYFIGGIKKHEKGQDTRLPQDGVLTVEHDDPHPTSLA